MIKRLLLFIIGLLFFMSTYAQSGSEYRFLKLKESQVYFESIYQTDSASSMDMKSRLGQFIPNIKSLKDYRVEGDLITATISGVTVDYRKYGGKWGNTATFLNHPFSANLNIVWKANKYKATVTNIIFHTAGFGDSNITDLLSKGKSDRSWVKNKTALQAGVYIEKYLYDLLSEKKNEDW